MIPPGISRWDFLFGLFYGDGAVFTDGDGHAVFDIVQELIAQAVYNGHLGIRQPHGSQNRAGGSQRVDGVGEEHTGGLTAHGAGAVQYQAAGGGTDGLGLPVATAS